MKNHKPNENTAHFCPCRLHRTCTARIRAIPPPDPPVLPCVPCWFYFFVTQTRRASARTRKNKPATPGRGRWTPQEHQDFLVGLKRHGRDWKAVSEVVKTRTHTQTRTHHQKYDQQTSKGKPFPGEVRMSRTVDFVFHSFSFRASPLCQQPRSILLAIVYIVDVRLVRRSRIV